mgnify:CR=1 FL=1
MREYWDRLVQFVRAHPKGILATMGGILGVVLMLQNDHSVRSHFLFWTVKMPMVVWAFFFGGLGYLSGKGIEWALHKRKKR